jgi:tetratricopeptide (TPR) repeat protein
MGRRTVGELESILAQDGAIADRIETLLELNEALEGTDYIRSVQICMEAVALATKMGDRNILARTHRSLGNVLWKSGENVKAQEHYLISLSICEDLNDDEGMTNAYCGLGIVHGNLNDSANALLFFEKGVAAAKRVANEVMLAHNLGNMGHIYASLGDHVTALQQFTKALAIDRELGDRGRQGVSNMLGAIAGVLVHQQEYDLAMANLEECLLIDEEIANHRGKAVTMLNMGITCTKAERTEESIKYLTDALAFAEKIHFRAILPSIHLNLSKSYEAIGNDAKALDHMREHNGFALAEERLVVQRKASRLAMS